MPASSLLKYTVRKAADNVYEYNTTFYNGTSPQAILLGRMSSISSRACINFNHLQIPAGSTITSAVLTLCGGDSGGSGTLNVNIYANDVDNAASPTTSAGIHALSLTDQYVNWFTSSAWTVNANYPSPDISSVIQEVVNRPGWVQDNNLMLVITNGSADVNAYKYVHSFNRAYGSPYRTITLEITFTHPCIFVGQIQDDADDGYYRDPDHAYFQSVGTISNYLGESPVTQNQLMHQYFRFTGVNIAQGARIKEAKIIYIGRDSETTNTSVPIVSIVGNDVDSAVAPTNYTEVSTLTKTSASATWLDVPAWEFTGDVPIVESTDISNVVEEIVGRAGWESGNAMAIMLETILGSDDYKTFTDYGDFTSIAFAMRGGITHIYIDATTQSKNKIFPIMYIR